MVRKRRILKAAIAADLINKVYAAEGWTKVRDEVRSRRVQEVYVLSVDHRAGRYVATPKVGMEHF